MKLVEDKTRYDIESFGSKSISMEIDASNTGILFSILSENLYSDIYGSIIRELVSNAWDANKEAGNGNKPVYVHFNGSTETDSAHISIVDCGPGISEDRVEKIYGKYLASTKRDTNDQIGGWGLGSKTPLAYNDYFQISTVCDGKKYIYIMRKGVSNTILELLHTSNTDEVNGTQIKIYMKEEDDLVDFFNSAKDQLAFFDNVLLLANEEALLTSYGNRYSPKKITIEKIDEFNSKKIYNFRHFSICTDNDDSCIVLGQVKYPLPKDVSLGWGGNEFGIKFSIGELPVTPSREGILWTPAAMELFKERFSAAVEEMQALIKKESGTEVGVVEYYLNDQSLQFITVDDVRYILPAKMASTYNGFNPSKHVDLTNRPHCKYLSYTNYGAFNNNDFERVFQSLISLKNKYWEQYSSKLRESKWSRKNFKDVLKGSGIYLSFDPNVDNPTVKRDYLVYNKSKFTDNVYFLNLSYKSTRSVRKSYVHFLKYFDEHEKMFRTEYTKKQIFLSILEDIKTVCDKYERFYDLPFNKVAVASGKKTIPADSVAYNLCSLKKEYHGIEVSSVKGDNIQIDKFLKLKGKVMRKGAPDFLTYLHGGIDSAEQRIYSIADSKFEKYKQLFKQTIVEENYDVRLANAAAFELFFSSISGKYSKSDWIRKFANCKQFLDDVDTPLQVINQYIKIFGYERGYHGGRARSLETAQFNNLPTMRILMNYYQEKGWINQDIVRILEDVHHKMEVLEFTKHIKDTGFIDPVITQMITTQMLRSEHTTRAQKIQLLTKQLKSK